MVTAVSGAADTAGMLGDAASHWRRANVLPVLQLNGSDIATEFSDVNVATAARRLAVLADEAEASDAAPFGLLTLLMRALTDQWPRPEREAQLPVLFDRRSTGAHGLLRLAVLDTGPPGLYPDPRVMLFLTADPSFAESLDAAWRIAGQPIRDKCVVWRLTSEDLPCDEVGGASLGAAFGVILTDLARRMPPSLRVRRLDRRVAISARLEADLRLTPVTGVTNKLDEAIHHGLRVILAAGSAPDTVPDSLAREARVRFAADLPAAVRLSRTRFNPSFAAIVVALLLAISGLTGGAVAAIHQSQIARQREVAAGLLPAATALRTRDPGSALLLEGLAYRLGAPGARSTLIRDIMTNRYAGQLTSPATQKFCGGPQVWSPDSTHVITLQRSAVLIWDIGTRSVRNAIAVSGEVSGCAFSPDGKTIALAVDDRLYVVPVGATTLPPAATDTPVHWVQYAPDGLLATMAENQPVRLWTSGDARRPSLRASIATVTGPINGDWTPLLAFSRDSRLLAFAKKDGLVLTDVHDPDRPMIASSIPGAAESLAISVKGRLAVGFQDGRHQLWDINDPARPARDGGLPFSRSLGLGSSSIGFTPDGAHLISATDGSSYVWDMTDDGPVLRRTLAEVPSQVTMADLSPDGKTALVFTAATEPTLWRPSAWNEPAIEATLPLGAARVTGMAVQPDTNHLVVTAVGNAATLWDLKDAAHPRRLSTTGPRDGRGLAIGDDPSSASTDNADSAFSRDGRHFASPDGTGGIGIWEIDANEQFHRTGTVPAVGAGGIEPLALSPDGALLVALAYSDVTERAASVSLWEVRGDPRPVGLLPASTPPRSTIFSPDGRTLVTLGDNRTVTWWDVKNPALPQVLATRSIPPGSDGPNLVVYAPDSRRMFVTGASGPGTIWDTTDPAAPTVLGSVHAGAEASSDGAALVGSTLVLGTPGAINVWDVDDFRAASEAMVFAGGDAHGIYFGHIALTHDGLLAATHLANGINSTFSGEALIQLRDLRPVLETIADPIAATCLIAGHDLSTQLWREYASSTPIRQLCGH
ncbi:WD40 repeat domain-containing protein [Actinoplanes sp. NPDC020271]|uniref:WD40 repeat domain-containing protein n=1 Tax=Actinoplanes sp. NPDC020271 TaxID=3363896 RepID=UPI003791C3F9